jgi:hypothetical protein
LEDIDIAKRSLAELRSVGGDRESVGWLECRDVEGELEH